MNQKKFPVANQAQKNVRYLRAFGDFLAIHFGSDFQRIQNVKKFAIK